MHTGMRKSFETTRAAVAEVIDPSRVRWIGYSHFEPDECGALNLWLATAPAAQAVVNFVGAMVMLDDFAERPPRTVADGEVFETGRHRIRFLSTPHVPHGWDASLYFDETEKTLFCSDLFFQPGDPEPLIESGIAALAREVIREGMSGPLAKDMPYTTETDATLERLATLAPRTLAAMHGSSYRGDAAREIRELAVAIRELLGRSVEARGDH
jgi:flavorubredoxin